MRTAVRYIGDTRLLKLADITSFQEDNAEFYDMEYFISMEYRYFSGAHGSRVRHILAAVGDVEGKRCLDVGCGGGFFTNELAERGADVTGIDYSPYGIQFACSRYPDLDLRQQSALDLYTFANESFDVVTLLDTIEHISDHDHLLDGIYRILKPGGQLVISTDAAGSPWSHAPLSKLVRRMEPFSSEGRAFRLINKVERYRRRFKDYHVSHIAELSAESLVVLLEDSGFDIIDQKIYPLVGVPMRDIFFRLLPKAYRGNHQTVVAQKSP
jgi:ubiquinone/menaquinone biosynthesis C-methylase UbiE